MLTIIPNPSRAPVSTKLTPLLYTPSSQTLSDEKRHLQSISSQDYAKCWKSKEPIKEARIEIVLKEPQTIDIVKIRNFGTPSFQLRGFYGESQQFTLIPTTVLIPLIDIQENQEVEITQNSYSFAKRKNPLFQQKFYKLELTLINPYHDIHPRRLGLTYLLLYKQEVVAASTPQKIYRLQKAPDPFNLEFYESALQLRQQKAKESIRETIKKKNETIEPAYIVKKEHKANHQNQKKLEEEKAETVKQKYSYHIPEIKTDKKEKEKEKRHLQQFKQTSQKEALNELFYTISGYQNPQRRELRKVLQCRGAKYQMDLESKERRVDLVIGRYKRAPKTLEARKMKIPVISVKWVEEVDKEDKLVPFRGFELK